MISQAQRWKFFPAVNAAWAEHCRINGLVDNSEQKDAWYREEMETALNEAGMDPVRSVKNLDPVAGYDVVMLHFALVAGDDRAIGYFSSAVERRCRHRIKILLAEISDLELRECDWNYARGIAKHMQLPLRLEDCPADMLKKVTFALDTHRRRILASRGELDTRKPGLGSQRWDREFHYRKAK